MAYALLGEPANEIAANRFGHGASAHFEERVCASNVSNQLALLPTPHAVLSPGRAVRTTSFEKRDEAQLDAFARMIGVHAWIAESGVRHTPGNATVGIVELEEQRFVPIHVREIPPAVLRVVAEDRGGRAWLSSSGIGPSISSGLRNLVDDEETLRTPSSAPTLRPSHTRERRILRRRREGPPEAAGDKALVARPIREWRL